MRLKKEDDYALRIIRCLNGFNNNEFIDARTIAEKENISKQEVFKVINKLKHSNIVESSRGKTGGYRLLVDIKTITLLDLFEILGVQTSINECTKKGSSCFNNDRLQCRVNYKLIKIQKIINQELSNESIYDILNAK